MTYFRLSTPVPQDSSVFYSPHLKELPRGVLQTEGLDLSNLTCTVVDFRDLPPAPRHDDVCPLDPAQYDHMLALATRAPVNHRRAWFLSFFYPQSLAWRQMDEVTLTSDLPRHSS
ncbi:hypothetical protein Bbelb_420990 [Branchiostoma belcheri]|nr:hypothetical protein Bbelb_420990 [Branchiostoma belcheri]